MKISISRAINLAAIAALACAGCTDNGVDSGGRADNFVKSFNDGNSGNNYYALMINVAPLGGGSVSRSSEAMSYRAGDSVTVTAAAWDGYRFVGWSGVSNAVAPTVKVAINRDLTLTANFIPFIGVDTVSPTIQHCDPPSPNEVLKGVTFTDPGALSSDGRGNALIYTSIVNAAGDTVPEINTSTAGDVFNITYNVCKTLRYSNGATAEQCASTMREVRVIEPQTVPEYTLVIKTNPADGGGFRRSPEKDAYSAGEQVRVTAAAYLGYEFVKWSGASTSADTSVTITMSGSLTLTANFQTVTYAAANYTVTFNANDGTVTPASGTTGANGTLQFLPTPTRSGYTFDGWYDGWYTTVAGGAEVTTSTVFSANATIYARWTGVPTPTITMFTDSRDATTYKKVTIGTQTWMAENLNYDVADSKCYGEGRVYDYETEGWKTLSNAEVQANCAKYGHLYDWSTAMGIDASYNNSSWNGSDLKHRGVCPEGWHLPSDTEWTRLTDFVGASAGKKLRSTTGWEYHNDASMGTDIYGFSALPGGEGNGSGSGSFGEVGYFGVWWSATEINAPYARGRYMFHSDHASESVSPNSYDKSGLFSVRCAQD